MKKYFLPLGVLGIFMTIAVTLWLTRDNIFYLFNFSYIGISIFFGIFLYIKKYKYARRVAQLLVGLYMLVYLGFICGENMQIEGFCIIFLQGYLKPQQFIMRWQKFSDHCFLAEVGVGMPVGRQWCLIFFRIKFPKHHGKRLGG